MGLLSSPSIEELIQDVRNYLNQPYAPNSFWSDDEIASYLDKGVRRYFVEVVNTGEGDFVTTALLDVTANTPTVPLPTDCFKVKNLFRVTNSGYEILNYKNNLTRSITTLSTSAGIFFPDYSFRGTNLLLEPQPSFDETGALLIEYVQFPTTLVTGGDTLTSQISPIFKDLITAYAVYQAKIKESLVSGSDTTEIAKMNLNDLYIAFQTAVQGRSMGPTFVQPFNPEEY